MNNLVKVQQQIASYAKHYGRNPADILLLAVTKTQPVSIIQQAIALGQRHFAENYLQEALTKIQAINNDQLIWHFIGPIQSNKTADIAKHFAWVHSVDRLKIAERLSQQRPKHLPPLNVCIQVNIDAEPTKSGVAINEVANLAKSISQLPNLSLRGLMAIPKPSDEFEQQRQPLRALKQLLSQLNRQGFQLDTLSMGMSQDLEAAIAEGATCVRIGTALFGARTQ
jgi:pyridoxal phosphate enzyme (YggS family)